jgi:ferredoxin-nitrite reductase
MPATEELTQVERDKLDINPDFDFRQVAERPFDELTPNEIGMFKWSGVYHQLQKGNFMIRLRMPGGLLTSEQLRRAADLAESYAQDLLCITTRQCLQFHWVQQGDIYKIIEGMEEVGILTKNACGDVCRNVVSCSLQGVCPYEIGDTREMVELIADDPVIRDELRNLPRKHKISVSGCGAACGQALMNCQGWFPTIRTGPDGNEEPGWSLTAGGGLGALPHMGKLILAWVPEELVVPVARAVVQIHNRCGNRRKRKYARLKIVVDTMGVAAFTDLLLEVLRENGVEGLDRIERATSPEPELKPFPFEGYSVIAQKQAGLNTVRIMVPRSELTGTETRQVADWAETHGNGQVMFTNRQNLEIRNIPDDGVAALKAAIDKAGCRSAGHEHLPDIVACVGTTMCNLAVSDTPNAYHALTEAFADDDALWKEVGPLRINMNGCPNGCAQHWIADIGLRGRRTRGETGSEEGFTIHVGGRLDANGHIGEVALEVAATDIVPAIRALLSVYLSNRNSRDERFGDYARRIGGEAFGELASEVFEAETHEPANRRNLRLKSILNQAFAEAKAL